MKTINKSMVFGFVLLGLLVLGETAGCSNPILLPRTARLSASPYGGDYPFMLTVEAYQLMRFNVHTFALGHEKVPVRYEWYLKRDSGILGAGDFHVIPESVPIRGRISIQDDKVIIDVEGGHQSEPNGAISWTKADENGEYRLIRGESGMKPPLDEKTKPVSPADDSKWPDKKADQSNQIRPWNLGTSDAGRLANPSPLSR